MTSMTINQNATAARENARQSTGEFGAQEHSAPEATLAYEYTEATGPEVTVIAIATGDGYEQFTLAEARKHLGLPDTEDEATVIALAALLAEDIAVDYPPYATQEPTYGNPGMDGTISTGHWLAPGDGVKWEADTRAWESDDAADNRFYMMPTAVIDPANYGYSANESDAFEAIVTHYGIQQGIADTDFASIGDDGKLRLCITEGFAPEEFVPRVVERRFQSLFEKYDPALHLGDVRRNGIVFDDDTIREGHALKNGRAFAYAESHGRIPTDAEVIAMLRDFRINSTLRQGFLVTSTGKLADSADNISEADRGVATKALHAWFNARKAQA